MANQSMLRARGLHTYKNYLSSIPEGALIKAENTVIDREGVIEPRRGIGQYGILGTTEDRSKQLLVYKDRILAHYSNSLAFDDGTGTFVNFSGSYSETESGLRIKGAELNGNFYFTESTGIKKISANSSTALADAYIGDAGAPNALDVSASLVFSAGGFLAAYSEVSYRVVWVRKDANDILNFGRPSTRTVVLNPTSSTANVNLKISIPDSIIEGDFFQVYRTEVDSVTVVADLGDLASGDEMRLVYESPPFGATYPTTFEITDIAPDSFRNSSANLYTNELTGEGILQANDIPPHAKDIEVFRNSMFFANTKTRHSLLSNLTGLSGISDATLGIAGITQWAGITQELTTTTNHNLTVGDHFVLYGTEVTDLDGVYQVKQVTSATQLLFDNALVGFLVGAGTAGVVGTANLVLTRNTDVNRFYFMGRQEVVQYTAVSKGALSNDTYFYLDAACSKDENGDIIPSTQYYVWLNKGGGTDPNITGRVGIEVDLTTATTDAEVAALIKEKIEAATIDFIIDINGAILTITSLEVGTSAEFDILTDTSEGTLTAITRGIGEDISRNFIKASTLLAPLDADATARSIVRVINQSATSNIVTALYLSTGADAPGKMLFESKVFDNESFTLALNGPIAITNNLVDGLGDLFDSSLPEVFTASIAGNVLTILSPFGASYTAAQYNISQGSTLKIEGEDSFFVVSSVNANQITLATTPVSTGTLLVHKTDVISNNEESKNRLYFSKYNQPDAVPALNFIDIGPKDKAILRIKALRDSLFVFKEDGIYRVSGIVAPNFAVQKFDTTILIAPDSVATLNNQIYALASQGVVTVTETGVIRISGDIEEKFTEIATDSFSAFRTATFGIGYEQDRAYIIWTVEAEEDTYATKAYRFNTATQVWTEWTRGATCGAVVDYINESGVYTNKIYIGAGDINAVEAERKSFTREDYADRQFNLALAADAVLDIDTIVISSVSNVEKGDVIRQTQYLTPYEVEKLAKRFTLDTQAKTTIPTANLSFYSNFTIQKGDALHIRLAELISQLNADLGTAFTSSFNSDFATLQSEYNNLMDELNTSPDLTFSDYEDSSGVKEVEMVVEDIVFLQTAVIGKLPLFLQGPIVHYQGIKTDVVYAPMFFGDPAFAKQVREFTIMFVSDNIDISEISFNTDLSPNFEGIGLSLQGTGVWGYNEWGNTTWGGEGTASPFRTLIPRQKQRCRFIRARYEHGSAFSKYQILGISYAFRMTNTRAYR